MQTLTPQHFQRLILNWFDQYGRKHLPWQQNKTPYRVFISEIMLQQTQVNTVIPYFERFMERFPDIASLAYAKEDEVMYYFAGLGYYRRARYLHRAAKMILEEFNGEFPHTLENIQTLPGVGQSTAGAILSIAFNQATPILDGNVKRVLARLYGIKKPINEKATENKLWAIASSHMPKKRAADYTQAMMDLGATLCLRRKPSCMHCPLNQYCIAYQKNWTADLPKKTPTKTLPLREATFFIFKKNHDVLLLKRPAEGIWGGLFSFPEIKGQIKRHLISSYCEKHFQIKHTYHQILDPIRHTFTHFHLDIFPIMIEIDKKSLKPMAETKQIWYNVHQPKRIGLPKPVQTILRALR